MRSEDRDAPPASSNRRRRRWEATRAEIRSIGRGLLAEKGPAAVTINAIARRMGVSGPALYRYFPSQGALIEALREDFFDELTARMREAAARAPALPAGASLLATCRALRQWTVAHPAEFCWLFANPLGRAGTTKRPGGREGPQEAFGRVFLEQVAGIWKARRFPVPATEDLPAAQGEQLRAFSARIGERLPPEAAHVYLTAWTRLYGLLCMEVFGQIDFAYDDVGPVYEECLKELCVLFGVPYAAPAAGPP